MNCWIPWNALNRRPRKRAWVVLKSTELTGQCALPASHWILLSTPSSTSCYSMFIEHCSSLSKWCVPVDGYRLVQWWWWIIIDDVLLINFCHHVKTSATWKPKVTFNNKLSSNHLFPATKLASWKPQMERCWWWTRVHSNVSIPRTRPRPVNSCTFFVFFPSVAAWQGHNALTVSFSGESPKSSSHLRIFPLEQNPRQTNAQLKIKTLLSKEFKKNSSSSRTWVLFSLPSAFQSGYKKLS